jgi:hypothetical protein
MRYARYEVHWTDEDGDIIIRKYDTLYLAVEYKMLLNSLKWAGEKLNNIRVVTFT